MRRDDEDGDGDGILGMLFFIFLLLHFIITMVMGGKCE